MNMINRRHLLLNAGGLGVTALLAACATTPSTGGGTTVAPAPSQITPAQLANYANLIAAGVLSLSPTLAGIGLPASSLSTVDTIANDIQGAATSFASADTLAAQKTLVQRVVADVSSVLSTIANIESKLPAGAQNTINAIETLAPYLETAIGVAVTVFGARQNTMSVDQAVAVLRGASR